MHPPAKQETTSPIIERFFAVLKELHTEPYLARDEKEAGEVLNVVLSRFACKFAILAGLPPQVRKFIENSLAAIQWASVEGLKPAEALSSIAKADVGITWAEYGVANQGAIMEVVYDDGAKLASSLPFNHIVLMSSKRLFEDISEAMLEVGRIIKSSQANKKPVITFISGPSKTGDIEMKLLYGVHGPNTLSVLALDWV